ncbi:TPA: hypothetical protein OCY20_002120 [Escherichia coli]|nr:hypothetical protein [Escherichia coli]
MKKLRIGVVGLGGIAQKAWLPVLAVAIHHNPGRLFASFSACLAGVLPVGLD